VKTAAHILIAATLLGGGVGCGNHTEPRVAIDPSGPPAVRNFDAVWHGSLEVLRACRFRIDRQDRRAGIITTRPMLARHWFEFWRRDAVSSFDLIEGTVQTVMRQAKVRIAPRRGRPDEYEPVVIVEMTRPDRQGLEIVAASEAYSRFFDSYDPEETGYERHKHHKRLKRYFEYMLLHEGPEAAEELAQDTGYRPRPPEWLGQDDTLAGKLAAEIRAAAAKRLARTK